MTVCRLWFRGGGRLPLGRETSWEWRGYGRLVSSESKGELEMVAIGREVVEGSCDGWMSRLMPGGDSQGDSASLVRAGIAQGHSTA